MMKEFSGKKLLPYVEMVVQSSDMAANVSKQDFAECGPVAIAFIEEQNKAINAMADIIKNMVTYSSQLLETNAQLNHVISVNEIIRDYGIK